MSCQSTTTTPMLGCCGGEAELGGDYEFIVGFIGGGAPNFYTSGGILQPIWNRYRRVVQLLQSTHDPNAWRRVEVIYPEIIRDTTFYETGGWSIAGGPPVSVTITTGSAYPVSFDIVNEAMTDIGPDIYVAKLNFEEDGGNPGWIWSVNFYDAVSILDDFTLAWDLAAAFPGGELPCTGAKRLIYVQSGTGEWTEVVPYQAGTYPDYAFNDAGGAGLVFFHRWLWGPHNLLYRDPDGNLPFESPQPLGTLPGKYALKYSEVFYFFKIQKRKLSSPITTGNAQCRVSFYVSGHANGAPIPGATFECAAANVRGCDLVDPGIGDWPDQYIYNRQSYPGLSGGIVRDAWGGSFTMHFPHEPGAMETPACCGGILAP